MLCVAIEEIAKACASSALILAVQDLGTLPIQLDGSAELQDRVLPRYASGEWLAAFALSEPDAGSDPGAMRTRAERATAAGSSTARRTGSATPASPAPTSCSR